jgi:hypothetical protein
LVGAAVEVNAMPIEPMKVRDEPCGYCGRLITLANYEGADSQ